MRRTTLALFLGIIAINLAGCVPEEQKPEPEEMLKSFCEIYGSGDELLVYNTDCHLRDGTTGTICFETESSRVWVFNNDEWDCLLGCGDTQ